MSYELAPAQRQGRVEICIDHLQQFENVAPKLGDIVTRDEG